MGDAGGGEEVKEIEGEVEICIGEVARARGEEVDAGEEVEEVEGEEVETV